MVDNPGSQWGNYHTLGTRGHRGVQKGKYTLVRAETWVKQIWYCPRALNMREYQNPEENLCVSVRKRNCLLSLFQKLKFLSGGRQILLLHFVCVGLEQSE